MAKNHPRSEKNTTETSKEAPRREEVEVKPPVTRAPDAATSTTTTPPVTEAPAVSPQSAATASAAGSSAVTDSSEEGESEYTRAGNAAFAKAIREGKSAEEAGVLAREAAQATTGAGPAPRSLAPAFGKYEVSLKDHPMVVVRATSREDAIEEFNRHYGIIKTPERHSVADAPDGAPCVNVKPLE